METIPHTKEKIIYLKIASFTTSKWFCRLEFFVEQDSIINPYGIHPPKDQNFFHKSSILDWLQKIDFSTYNSPLIFNYFKKPEGIEISEYLNDIIVSAMFKYWVKHTTSLQCPTNELEQIWVRFKEQIDCYDYFDEKTHFVENKLEECVRFYNLNNYENFVEFISKLEENILLLNPQYCLKNCYWELLLSELILKNLGRPFFINETSYGIDEINHMKYKNYDPYYGNVLRHQNLSLASHLIFSTNTIDKFNIKVIWPWCSNSVLKSTIHKNISVGEYVTVNLKDVLRYSQNLINSKFKNSDYFFKNFIDFYEWFIPIFSTNYIFQDSRLNLDDRSKLNKKHIDLSYIKFSSHHSDLMNDAKISQSFIYYCLEFEKYLKVAPKNIYIDDFYLRIPFWEIPRIQFINLELFIVEQDNKAWDERIAASERYTSNHEYLGDNEYLTEIKDKSDEEFKDIYIQSIRDHLDWDPDWKEASEREMREDYDDCSL